MGVSAIIGFMMRAREGDDDDDGKRSLLTEKKSFLLWVGSILSLFSPFSCFLQVLCV